MHTKVKIGNAQAFWGDTPTAPATLIAEEPDLDYLTLDYLSELSMSILAIQREKDPSGGYASDFIDVIRSLIPFWKQGLKFKVITNAGGLNPRGCAEACLKLLRASGCPQLKIGVLEGDDVLQQLKDNSSSPLYCNLESGRPLMPIAAKLITANAYVGSLPIVELLHRQSDIIITGRIADPCLTVAPAIFHHGWSFDQYDHIAQATVAGHLIECGTQVTGGFSNHWHSLVDPAHIGFPWVEIASDGTFIISKPAASSGRVDERTIKEQLLYEIGDPANYISPDVCLSLLDLKLEGDGFNRMKITGAKGRPPPPTLKVSATYRHGYKAEGMIAYYGLNPYETAQSLKVMLQQRVSMAGYELQDLVAECIGSCTEGDKSPHPTDCMLRFAAAAENKKAIDAFAKEIAPLITSGPQGLFGYTSARPKTRPAFGYWPCLIPSADVALKLEIIS
jgi:hypothetical protein